MKKQEVQSLIRLHNPDMICVQETKQEVVDKSLCAYLFLWILIGVSSH